MISPEGSTRTYLFPLIPHRAALLARLNCSPVTLHKAQRLLIIRGQNTAQGGMNRGQKNPLTLLSMSVEVVALPGFEPGT
jgi:hypothetical protein